MHLIPGYSMLASTATTLMLSIIFLILSQQSRKTSMRLWGISWLIYSAMFFLDFLNLQVAISHMLYIMLRQITALMGSYIFLLGTHRFFQRKPMGSIAWITTASLLLILLYPLLDFVYTLALIPNVICCSGMLFCAGCMFISFSWTQHLPEKMIASFFIIVWGIFINHFGFSLNHESLAISAYFIGIFTVNVLILILVIIYFKKARFLDTRQASRFRLLVENSSDSMFLYDYRSQEFEYVSPSIAGLIGVTDRQLYEMPDRFFDYVNTMEQYKDIVGIFSRPISHPGSGILCLYRSGTIVRWSEVHYLPIRDNTGTVTAIEGILRDITERKTMEEDLKAAEQVKKEFLENISHEIKTPVTLIQGYAESLLDKVVPAESSDTYLKLIGSKARMLTTLVDDLAQASHITSQTLEYRFYEQQAGEIFAELLSQSKFHVMQAGREAVIQSEMAEQTILIADPYRIQQVVSNMISNAIRHTPPGQRIYVSCRAQLREKLSSRISEEDYSIPDGELIFAVSDTGSGIPEEDLPHIFERNFSGGRRLDPDAAGAQGEAPRQSGLGLYISMQIIKQHSGTMGARNNLQGGAEIFFTLPLYRMYG